MGILVPVFYFSPEVECGFGIIFCFSPFVWIFLKGGFFSHEPAKFWQKENDSEVLFFSLVIYFSRKSRQAPNNQWISSPDYRNGSIPSVPIRNEYERKITRLSSSNVKTTRKALWLFVEYCQRHVCQVRAGYFFIVALIFVEVIKFSLNHPDLVSRKLFLES